MSSSNTIYKKSKSEFLTATRSSTESFYSAKELSPVPYSRVISPTPSSSTGLQPAPEDDNVGEVEEDAYKIHPGLILLFIFICCVGLMFLMYLNFPEMDAGERKYLKLPMNMQEAKQLARVLKKQTRNHYYTVLMSFSLVYIFLQSFAIPGSIFLSIMSGFLFSFWIALILVCFCSATGALFCYLLSWLVGRPIIRAYFSEIIRHWREVVRNERANLLYFMIFLRVTPILPNWLINIVSPQIGVPMTAFWLGTFIGVAPPSVLAVQAGSTLNMMTSPSDQFSWTSIIVLSLIALGSLVPVIWRRWGP